MGTQKGERCTETVWRHVQKAGTVCKKRQAVPREACSAHSLPLDFQTSEQWQNKCVALLLSRGVCYDSLAIKLLSHFTQPTCSNWPSTAFAHLVINPKAQITWLMFSVGATCFDYILIQLASSSAIIVRKAIPNGWSFLCSLLVLHLQIYLPLLLLNVVRRSWAKNAFPSLSPGCRSLKHISLTSEMMLADVRWGLRKAPNGL